MNKLSGDVCEINRDQNDAFSPQFSSRLQYAFVVLLSIIQFIKVK